MFKLTKNVWKVNKLNLFDDKYEEVTLDLVNMRLKNLVDKHYIYKWLNNFETDEKQYMLEVLLKMECITTNEIFERYFDVFKQFFNAGVKNDSLVLVHPIGKYEKSGTGMIYYINKVITSNELKKLIPKSVEIKFTKKLEIGNGLEENDLNSYSEIYLILVDDILGTGKTAINYYKHKIKNIELLKKYNVNINFIAIFSMYDAIANITSSIYKSRVFVSMLRNKAFKGSNILFKEQAKIRGICYKYGEKIYPENPLGYNNSQALVTFPYGSPNNTLPIIWMSSNKRNSWHPIFPRFISNKLSESKERRKEFAYWLSVTKLFGDLDFIALKKTEVDGKEKYSIDKKSYIYMYMLKLLKEKKDVPTICQELGIFEHEYNKYVKKGIDFKDIVINQENEVDLTEQGTKKCAEILEIARKKELNIYKYKNKEFKEIDYLPSTFRGES